MSNKEMITNTLHTYGPSTSKEIANLVIREYNTRLSPSQIAGSLRPLIAKGVAASSKNDKNVTVYWMN